ncbi:hypothetical protein [Pseudofrankia sp. BMG5.37]|uniref:hypothetical protein n=1 Tax=Pseudofrankia sp. BMG5.37 TaxID=3050035 RepID=UPI0008D95F45|nr:hypothetical protein [Pseudofrankia sp. BMG5.37]MDT3439346.1 hypothetical protein [Pseudofrankia sp. BMG5.37]OHV53759.1 hypothetical protein BCD48_44675 [Pseudofrankia sp. BMG5.36]
MSAELFDIVSPSAEGPSSTFRAPRRPTWTARWPRAARRSTMVVAPDEPGRPRRRGLSARPVRISTW